MSLREEQCNKVCRILDDVLANRPTERDSLITAVRIAFSALNCLEIPNSSDTISRQAAIDAVNCVMVMKGIRNWKSVAAEVVESAKSIIADNIRQLPPAQPEIIHCEECTFYEAEDGWCEMHSGYGFWEKAFCSFAKRREVTT